MILNINEDYHVHSNYNDHSSPDMTIGNVLRRAKELGLQSLAITEHVRKTSDWISNYLAEIETRTKDTDVKVIPGFEAKILADGSIDCPERYLENYFIIASIHSKYDKITWFNAVKTAIQDPSVDVLGHLGPDQDWSEFPTMAEIAEIASLSADNGKIIELNTKYRRPPPEWLHVFKERGVRFHLGSDAHSLNEIGQFQAISHLIAIVEDRIFSSNNEV